MTTETKLVTVASPDAPPEVVAGVTAILADTGLPVRSRPYWRDVAERAGATFLETLLGTSIVGAVAVGANDSIQLNGHAALAGLTIAGTATALSVLKGLLARLRGDTGSASLDPSV